LRIREEKGQAVRGRLKHRGKGEPQISPILSARAKGKDKEGDRLKSREGGEKEKKRKRSLPSSLLLALLVPFGPAAGERKKKKSAPPPFLPDLRGGEEKGRNIVGLFHRIGGGGLRKEKRREGAFFCRTVEVHTTREKKPLLQFSYRQRKRGGRKEGGGGKKKRKKFPYLFPSLRRKRRGRRREEVPPPLSFSFYNRGREKEEKEREPLLFFPLTPISAFRERGRGGKGEGSLNPSLFLPYMGKRGEEKGRLPFPPFLQLLEVDRIREKRGKGGAFLLFLLSS